MATVNDYAALSANAYKNSGEPDGWTRLDPPANLQVSDPSFSAAAYGRYNSDGTLAEVVVAYRGSGTPVQDPADWVSNGQLLVGQKPAQYDAAAAFYEAVRE
jgi:hypothetical protein